MMQKPTLTIVALGDSITTAFNAHGPDDNLDYSWSTGGAADRLVKSHRLRLETSMAACRIVAHNTAIAGARAADLEGQARKLAGVAPDYATLLIGANDLAQWMFLGEFEAQLAQFVGHVRTTVEGLIRANARVLVLLVAIPDQSRVLDLLLASGPGAVGRFAPQLNPALLGPLRQAYVRRHERVNQALAQIAEAWPANVRFAANVAKIRFDRVHLSALDFYHPSLEGQALLAEATWQMGFWV